jgi:hypothetical protein
MVFASPNDSHLMVPERKEKVIKGTDFWAYRLAKDVVYEAFQRHQSIVHAAENAFLLEKKEAIRKA